MAKSKKDLLTMAQLWFNTSCYKHETYYNRYRDQIEFRLHRTDYQRFAEC